ncbi:hypothetical protein K3179_12230 [Qipengyuania sp. GH38]|uniref:hypothetical protein n=1 Tax=Qipengyuania intermedia TaxID=2867244 RepID=UPI001C8793F7|nr:hypothetical protein [Qipengyuania intermedia]MBX7515311.1 hypothetical protein [Qipengyuania intermedia]
MAKDLAGAKDGSEGDLRAALSRGDQTLSRIEPILGHLLSTPDHSLFSDEILARLRGMLNDLAWQILRVQAQATGQSGREAFAERHGEALAMHLQANPAMLSHCHALAVEWQLTERLEAQYGIDPVLSPALQGLIASEDAGTASTAMSALAAQARFVQAQRRMELPLSELPGDLFHRVLLTWRDYNGGRASDALTRAEAKLRSDFDEGSGRLALMARLAAGIGRDNEDALLPEKAGVGLFLTVLAAKSGQDRTLIVLATNARQVTRLALSLRSAGLSASQVDEVLLQLHPQAAPVPGLAELTAGEARSMLSDAAPEIGR